MRLFDLKEALLEIAHGLTGAGEKILGALRINAVGDHTDGVEMGVKSGLVAAFLILLVVEFAD